MAEGSDARHLTIHLFLSHSSSLLGGDVGGLAIYKQCRGKCQKR